MKRFDGRAPSLGMTQPRRADRAATELIGICRGLLADGDVSQQEAEFLHGWILRNAEFADRFPFNAIYARLEAALRDGVLDDDEQSDLLGALVTFVGGEAAGESASLSSALPLDVPTPVIDWNNYGYCNCAVTGVFEFGSRNDVMSAILRKGGAIDSGVLKRTNYLIVGEIGSRDWVHSSFGRKIELAIRYREEGTGIAIVGERDWTAQVA